MKKDKISKSEWEKLAREIEDGAGNGTLEKFKSFDEYDTLTHWNNIRLSEEENIIDTDSAWKRIDIMTGASGKQTRSPRLLPSFKYAAAVAVLAAIGSILLYLVNNNSFSATVTKITDAENKNIEILLPEGSSVILNRNTSISYPKNFGKTSRTLTLEGEAFFNVSAGHDIPFIIRTGDASVEVVGTSFNVITTSSDREVEVFVKTGIVKLSDNENRFSILLEPGYIGSFESNKPVKNLNADMNYLAWNTGVLKYNGESLDIVFRDLHKVYNINVIPADTSILNETWVSPPIDNMQEETIIQLICGSFNLDYEKEGNVYRLSEK